ncbi:hypothetical protein WJM97_00400 [Okeanomitos corallinicola TIOX110]|uniref:Uncharacterized protein n=1 Tax=Okeanomitos corallinicola TIOX110 TaxID=3133117 RepID=A0ABZ2US21_9CYAN
MTTEREYREWQEKIRKVRGQRTISKPVNKPVKSYSSGLLIMFFLILIGGLLALKVNTSNQEPVPSNQKENLEYLNPTKT